MIALLAAALILAVPGDVNVDPDPDKPGTILDGVKRKKVPPITPPIPIWNPGAPDSDSPPAYEPDPFFCRPEAPFPNDECITPPEEAEPVDEPEVTPPDIEREVRRIGLPRLSVTIQPAGSTLVNLETIFHTTATPFERTVDILDSTVVLRAAPVSYTWHHGDRTTQTTAGPGRPYPAMDVTHQYARPGNVTPSVDVTYRVTYRIDDGDWQTLDTTITAPGPATALRIREARPVLTD